MKLYTFHIIVFFILLGLFSCGEECDPTRQYAGKDYRAYCNTPAWDLVKALENGDLSTAKDNLFLNSRLVDYQDPNYHNSILFWATLNENKNNVDFLLYNGAKIDNLNSDQKSPIELAAFNYTTCDSKILDSLIHYLPKLNSTTQGILNNALIDASSQPCLRKIKLLIEAGASPNFKRTGNFNIETSPLSEAAIQGRYKNLAYLLETDDVNIMYGIHFRSNGDTVTLKQLLLEDLEKDHLDQEKIRPIILDLIARIDRMSIAE